MANAFMKFAEKLIDFPAVDDVERMSIRNIVQRTLNQSPAGRSEGILFGARDEVEVEIAELVTAAFREDLIRWWGFVRGGRNYTFGFDDTLKGFGLVAADALNGASAITVLDGRDFTAGDKILIQQDVVLGYSRSKNLLTVNQADVETDTAGFTAFGITSIARNLVEFNTGAASLKMSSVTGTSGARIIPSPALLTAERYSFSCFLFSDFGSFPIKIRLLSKIGGAQVFEATFTIDGTWRRYAVPDAAFKPESGFAPVVEFITDGTTRDFFYDTGKLEKRSYLSPFSAGGASSGPSSVDGFETIAEIASITAIGGSVSKILNLTVALPFDVKAGDVVRHERFWPLVASLDEERPIDLTALNFNFLHRFREVSE